MRKAFEIETTVGARNEEILEFLKRLKYTKDLIQSLIQKEPAATELVKKSHETKLSTNASAA